MLTLGGPDGGLGALYIGASGQEDPPTAVLQPGTLSKCAHARPARTSIVHVVPDARPPPRLRVLPGTVDLDRATCEARAPRSGRSGPGCAAARLETASGGPRATNASAARATVDRRTSRAIRRHLSIRACLSAIRVSSIQHPVSGGCASAGCACGRTCVREASGRGGGAAGCSMHGAGVRPECGAVQMAQRSARWWPVCAARPHVPRSRPQRAREEKRREFKGGEGGTARPKGASSDAEMHPSLSTTQARWTASQLGLGLGVGSRRRVACGAPGRRGGSGLGGLGGLVIARVW